MIVAECRPSFLLLGEIKIGGSVINSFSMVLIKFLKKTAVDISRGLTVHNPDLVCVMAVISSFETVYIST